MIFQNLNLGNASANPIWHLTISWASSCQYQSVCKVSSQQSTQFGHFHFFRIWSSAQPRPMLNVILQSLGLIWQSLCLDHVNSNGYAKFYQNIPKGSRDRASFTFFRIWTSAKPRPIPNVIWQSYWLHLININVYAKFHHNSLHSSRDKTIFTFSEFGARQSLDR